MNKKLVKTIQKEDQENSILVFYDAEESTKAYGLQSYGFKELLLLQFTEDNINLLKSYDRDRIKEILTNKLTENLQPILWQGADYFVGESNSYISIVRHEGVSKQRKLLENSYAV